MPTYNSLRKIPEDWHPWDIRAALGKRGYTFALIARELNLAKCSAQDVLRKPSPNIQNKVADIIGVKPWEIWPSRYDDNNEPLHRYGSRTLAANKRAIP